MGDTGSRPAAPAAASADKGRVLLRMDGIVKTFPGGVRANRGVNLEVHAGEIHALLGENGAGKTVLMSILYGLYPPDAGTITFRGRRLEIRSPRDAIRNRIGMVHQHFMLVDSLTVVENIILGQYPALQVFGDLATEVGRITQMSRDYGLDIDPTARVADLSVGAQQRVEILKALYHGADLLILDEPTAVLTPQESQRLLTFLRRLADDGLTIVLITHNLDEVMRATDRVTILRDGAAVATVNTRATNPHELARLMVGREVLLDIKRATGMPGDVVFAIERLRVDDGHGLAAVRDVSLTVRAGEVVGIAGVSGNGQSELALALAGLLPCTYASYRLDGRTIAQRELPRLNRLGLAHIPEDRQKMGLVLPFSVSENFIAEAYDEPPFAKAGFLAFKPIRDYALAQVRKFSIRVGDVDEEIAHLSGGNQQKVVVARELERQPRFLLVNQPTRGIDIGATAFVRQEIMAARERGAAILLISTDLEEILALSDRILVMFGGRIVGETPPDPTQIEQIGLMMAGHTLAAEEETS